MSVSIECGVAREDNVLFFQWTQETCVCVCVCVCGPFTELKSISKSCPYGNTEFNEYLMEFCV